MATRVAHNTSLLAESLVPVSRASSMLSLPRVQSEWILVKTNPFEAVIPLGVPVAGDSRARSRVAERAGTVAPLGHGDTYPTHTKT